MPPVRDLTKRFVDSDLQAASSKHLGISDGPWLSGPVPRLSAVGPGLHRHLGAVGLPAHPQVEERPSLQRGKDSALPVSKAGAMAACCSRAMVSRVPGKNTQAFSSCCSVYTRGGSEEDGPCKRHFLRRNQDHHCVVRLIILSQYGEYTHSE